MYKRAKVPTRERELDIYMNKINWQLYAFIVVDLEIALVFFYYKHGIYCRILPK